MLEGKNINSNLRAIQPEYKLAFSVDCVIFGYSESGLSVLLVECNVPPYEGRWSLLGDLVRTSEDLDGAVHRIIRMHTDLKDLHLEQVATFGNVNRHPVGRVITTAYYSLLKKEDYNAAKASHGLSLKWFPVDCTPELAFDHNNILHQCYSSMRRELRESPLGFKLLPKRFTLSQLQTLYEVILGIDLDKRNFRRKLRSLGILEDTGGIQRDVSHRPARLYRFDSDKYEEKISTGVHFAI